MSIEPANINKILEVDMDTDREVQINVRQVDNTVIPVQYRTRQPDGSVDLKDNIIILAHALAACVLRAEQKGVCKKGEAMQKATEILNECYVDAGAQIIERTEAIIPGGISTTLQAPDFECNDFFAYGITGKDSNEMFFARSIKRKSDGLQISVGDIVSFDSHYSFEIGQIGVERAFSDVKWLAYFTKMGATGFLNYAVGQPLEAATGVVTKKQP